MPASSFLRIVRPVTRPVGVLTERLGSRFYVGLGVIVAAA